MTREEKEQWDIFMKLWVIPALKNTWGEKKCKEIVEALEEWEEPCEDWYDVPSDEMTLKQARQAVKDLRKKLSEHLEQESKTGWILVSERLPEAGEYIGDVAKYYLVQNEYEDMLVARYTYGKYWEQIYQLKPIGDEIVAWMPLPKPYELKESEEV